MFDLNSSVLLVEDNPTDALLEKLKTAPVLSEIPVAVLTGSSQTRDMAEARRLGAEWYFVKKSEPRDLDLMVKALSRLVAS